MSRKANADYALISSEASRGLNRDRTSHEAKEDLIEDCTCLAAGEYLQKSPNRLNKVERRDGLLVTCTEEFGSGAI